MIVTRCCECPFFRETPLSAGVLAIFSSDELRRLGTCDYDCSTDGLIPHPPLGMKPSAQKDQMYQRLRARLPIKDNQQPPPDGCPLRKNPIIVALQGAVN